MSSETKRAPQEHKQKTRVPGRNGEPTCPFNVKNAWHKATHVRRVRPRPENAGDDYKDVYHWVKKDGAPSLKVWLANVDSAAAPELYSRATDWFHNKRAKTAKPHLGLGSTRKKKGSNSGSKVAAPKK